MVKDKVDNCLACQAVTPSKSSQIEPLQMTPLPSGPWKLLAMDFLGPFPSGDYLLVVIDEYSRFPEVEIVKSTSAKSVILRLDAMFARQGIPNKMKTDNGPPFNRVELGNFVKYLGFHHRKVQPLWPRANGEAERFMPNLEKCVQTMAERDTEQKSNIKAYADSKLGTKSSGIKLEDTVLVRQPKKNKLSTPYSPEPLVVEEKKGSMVTASDGFNAELVHVQNHPEKPES